MSDSHAEADKMANNPLIDSDEVHGKAGNIGLAESSNLQTNEFREATKLFEEWFRQESGACSGEICLRDARDKGAGRAVFSTADIEEDETLFEVPRSMILTVQNSILYRKIPEVLDKLEPWLALTVAVMYEHQNVRRGPTFHAESYWKPYFPMLPLFSKQFQPLMYWPESSLIELQASPVLERIGMQQVEDIFWSVVVPILKNLKDDSVFEFPSQGPDSEAVFLERFIKENYLTLYHGVASSIMAYAFDIEKDEEDREKDEDGFMSEEEDAVLPKGMVPMADMLNADADLNNARLFYESKALCMRAIKPIKKGEQIFNDYGPLPRSELLRRYGYLTPRYAKYDVAELSQELLTNIAINDYEITKKASTEKLQFLESMDQMEDGYNVVRFTNADTSNDSINSENSREDEERMPTSPFPRELITFVTLLLLPEPSFRDYKRRSKLPKGGKSNETLAPEILMLLVTACEQQLKKYATALEEDLRLLDEQEQIIEKQISVLKKMEHGTDECEGLEAYDEEENGLLGLIRKRQAMEVRIGEKEVLTEAMQFARQWSKER
ncbi:MAG: hypothetical protein M1820_000077 [Bogoriella megaspora]|nr:MAG: hypothetical protein M1820_000077 [Bogoriella megaspora]